jgi:hypothetical protein
MMSAARYSARAVELERIAADAADSSVRNEWRGMAASYRKLAALLDGRDPDADLSADRPGMQSENE